MIGFHARPEPSKEVKATRVEETRVEFERMLPKGATWSTNGHGGTLAEFNLNGWMWTIEILEDGQAEFYGTQLVGKGVVPCVDVKSRRDAASLMLRAVEAFR